MGSWQAVILAAGQGKRMRSARPKVVHELAGRPLVVWPVSLARALGCAPTVVVVGHGRDEVESCLRRCCGGDDLRIAVQESQRGTADAVRAALPELGQSGTLLVLSGDVPLLEAPVLRELGGLHASTRAPVSFLTFTPASPAGYGRVLRRGGKVVGVREERDASTAEREIREVNSGVYLIELDFLRREIGTLTAENEQHELYLPDLIAIAARSHDVPTLEVAAASVAGINDREDLASLDREIQRRLAASWMRAGVTLHGAGSQRFDVDVVLGEDCELGPGVELRGRTRLGRGVRVETGCLLKDTEVDEGAVIKAYSVLDGAVVAAAAEIGPFARLRPGARIGVRAHVGNFVEIKNVTLGEGAKANHLAYLGDGEVGARSNIGAGTIFCNYDGFQKHRTAIEEDVFIGSDSQLVAPVRVGRAAYVASGSTITKDVPPEALAISRVKQENKEKVGAVLRETLRRKKAEADRRKHEKDSK